MYIRGTKVALTDDFDLYLLQCTKLGATASDGGGLTVPNKTTYYRLAENRLLGNSLRTWNHPDQVTQTQGVFGLRNTQGGGGRFVGPHDFETINSVYQQWESAGFDMSRVIVSEGFERGIVVIQGEVQNSIRGIDLSYCTRDDLTCREAMRSPSSASGAVAWRILRNHLTGVALDTMEFLLTAYPDSVIEFSTTRRSMGWASDTTVFWEVRNY